MSELNEHDVPNTDRDLALMEACRYVFPEACHFLCRFHIFDNIRKHCRPSFGSKTDWDRFTSWWYHVVNSPTTKEYEQNRTWLQSKLIDKQNVFTYVDASWLQKYKEKFVSAWIDQHLNFGERTTNRVESQHSLLKKHLEEAYNKEKRAALKKSWLQKIRAIWDPSSTSYDEPRVQTKPRGRPSIKLKPATTTPPLQRSYSHKPPRNSSYVPSVGREYVQEPTRYSSFENSQDYEYQPSPSFKDNEERPGYNSAYVNYQMPTEYDFMGLNQHNVTYKKSVDYHKYIDQIPSVFRPYVEDIKNVLGDGNCGFRATASALGYNEGQWESIRRLLIDEMVEFETRYKNAFKEEYDGVFASLQWFGTTFAPPENWMIMPETGFVIVNKFNVIFHFISIENNNSSTLFPLWKDPDQFPDKNVITIARVDRSHFVMVEMQGEFPMGCTHNLWRLRRERDAVEWKNIFKPRQKIYEDWIARPVEYEVID